jgi:hypothetical protein
MEHESCRICGGDGRVGNAFGGSSTTCPGCHGTGRRTTEANLFRDVTKTKASHHQPAAGKGIAAVKATWPTTYDGAQLANEVKAAGLSEEVKAKLVREIIEYETTHGKCTQTFTKKIRKQVRPRSG